MHRTIGQFIDGRQVYASGCSTFDSINPANGQLLATVEQASAGQVDDAVLSASAAQREWVKLPVAERTAIMLDAAKLILLRNDELAQLETLDTGKPIFDTSRVDIKGGVAVMRYFAGLMAAIEGRQSPVGETAFTYTRREPLGVVAGVGAWNYPLQIAMWKLAPALAAGNAMVFKPSELTPLSTLRLAELLVEAGVPAGLFNVLQGNQAVGKALSEHPRYRQDFVHRERRDRHESDDQRRRHIEEGHHGTGWQITVDHSARRRYRASGRYCGNG
jgi:betaine-aldehyde dehydrogenase